MSKVALGVLLLLAGLISGYFVGNAVGKKGQFGAPANTPPLSARPPANSEISRGGMDGVRELEGEAFEAAFLEHMILRMRDDESLETLVAQKSDRKQLQDFAKNISARARAELDTLRGWQGVWFGVEPY